MRVPPHCPLSWKWLGRVSYAEGLRAQEELAKECEAGRGTDTLFLLEHESLYTAGRRTRPEELLWDEKERKRRGIALCETDRGGKLTYHGPGQLVGYPIVDIRARALSVREWVETIERSLIDYLRRLGLDGSTECGRPGVWTKEGKVAALGLHVSRGVSRHGFALNLSTDLSAYGGIIPCGIEGRAVVSVESLLGKAPSLPEAAAQIAGCLARRLDAGLEEGAPCRAAL